MEVLIQRVVDLIQERYSEPLNLDELARTAIMSKFHFLRTFRDVTGVTPGRFLSAVRLEAAKELLLTTSLNVSDISARVGYSSTGSFTRRFTESVGCSPTQYRHAGGLRGTSGAEEVANGANGADRADGADGASGGCISGSVRGISPNVSAIYIGVFDSPILERFPADQAMVTAPGRFRLAGVPTGTWWVHAVAHGASPESAANLADALLVDTAGPFEITADSRLELELTVRPRAWSHPPVLLALPDLGKLGFAA